MPNAFFVAFPILALAAAETTRLVPFFTHLSADRPIASAAGLNGEIEVMTQKREKLAIIPLSPELRDALDEAYSKRRPNADDKVMVSPDTGKPFLSRVRLYERMKALGIRAGVNRVTPHCFRDTFACDMLSRGNGIFEVAKILADTVDTVDKH